MSTKYDQVQPKRSKQNGTYLLLVVLIFVLLIGVANLVFLVLMYTVLDVNEDGMHAFTFFKDTNSLRWLIEAEFDYVMLHKSQIDGYSDQSLFIQGNDSQIKISIDRFIESSVSIMKNGSFIKTNNFRFVNPNSRATILDINSGRRLKMKAEMNGTTATFNAVKTPRVVSKIGSDLTLESNRRLILTGNEGLCGDAKLIQALANKDITFHIEDKNQAFEINGGLMFNRSYIKDTSQESTSIDNVVKFRLCYCENSNHLFLSEVTSNAITCAVALTSPC